MALFGGRQLFFVATLIAIFSASVFAAVCTDFSGTYGTCTFTQWSTFATTCSGSKVLGCYNLGTFGPYCWKVDETCLSNEVCDSGSCRTKSCSEYNSAYRNCTGLDPTECYNGNPWTCTWVSSISDDCFIKSDTCSSSEVCVDPFGTTGAHCECNPTNTTASYSCYNNDVYYYDNCGGRQSKKSECNDGTTYSANYCSSGKVVRDKTVKGCSSSSCTSSTTTETVQTCGSNQVCSSGSCRNKTCTEYNSGYQDCTLYDYEMNPTWCSGGNPWECIYVSAIDDHCLQKTDTCSSSEVCVDPLGTTGAHCECNPTNLTASSKCDIAGEGGDVYYYDNCGGKRDKKTECGNSGYGSPYCSGKDIYKDYVGNGCSSTTNTCYSTPTPILQSTCAAYQYCSSGACNNGSISSVSWSVASAWEGDTIILTANTSNIADGTKIKFRIFENDAFFDDDLNISYANVFGNKAVLNYKIPNLDDGWYAPEIAFTASVDVYSSISKTSSDLPVSQQCSGTTGNLRCSVTERGIEQEFYYPYCTTYWSLISSCPDYQYCSSSSCVNGSISSVSWSQTSAMEGDLLTLTANILNIIDGVKIDFNIFESDAFYNDHIETKSALVSGGKAVVTWVVPELDDGWYSPEVGFTASVNANKSINKTSSDLPVSQGCIINSASWSKSTANQWDTVYMNVSTSGCNGKTITLDIWEDDGILLPDDHVLTISAPVVGEAVSRSWVVPYVEDQYGGPEFYFEAKHGTKSKTSGNVVVSQGTVSDKSFENVEDLLGKERVTIISYNNPSGKSLEYLNLLKTEIQERTGYAPRLIYSSDINQSNPCWDYANYSANLVLIGDSSNNVAVNCFKTNFRGNDANDAIEIEAGSYNNPWALNKHIIFVKASNDYADGIAALKLIVEKGGSTDSHWYEGVIGCLWTGDLSFGGEIACNVIPIVELAPDIRDTYKCGKDKVLSIMSLEEPSISGMINEMVCGIVYAATAYDVASNAALIGGFFTAGGTAVVGAAMEIEDATIATFKVSFKTVLTKLDSTLIDAAWRTYKKIPKSGRSILNIIKRVPKSYVDDASEAIAKMLAEGPIVGEKGLKLLDQSETLLKTMDPKTVINAYTSLFKVESKLGIKITAYAAESGKATEAYLKNIVKLASDDKFFTKVSSVKSKLGLGSKLTEIKFIDEIKDEPTAWGHTLDGVIEIATDNYALSARPDYAEMMIKNVVPHEMGHASFGGISGELDTAAKKATEELGVDKLLRNKLTGVDFDDYLLTERKIIDSTDFYAQIASDYTEGLADAATGYAKALKYGDDVVYPIKMDVMDAGDEAFLAKYGRKMNSYEAAAYFDEFVKYSTSIGKAADELAVNSKWLPAALVTMPMLIAAAYAATPPQCSSGVCCDTNGYFKASSVKCASNFSSESRCSGSSIETRTSDKYCSGTASSCSGNLVWTAWATTSTCLTPYLCSNASCVLPACSSNAECGSDAWVGGTSCSDKNVIGLWRTYKCNSPGTLSASCSFTDSNKVKSVCASNQVCSSGACANVTCFNNSDCNDNNSSTFDSCVNPGTVSSTCTHANIICSSSAQCGTNQFIGSPFCSSSNVMQTFRTFTCNNAGTASSSCSFTDANQVNSTCTSPQICSSGACMTPACYSDANCGTNQFIGSPFCSANNVMQLFKTFKCNNPGTANASCSNSDMNQLKLACSINQTCTAGQCINNCVPSWTCSNWSACVNSLQSRDCNDGCGAVRSETQACTAFVTFRTTDLNYTEKTAVAVSQNCGWDLIAYGGTTGSCTEYNCTTSTAQFMVPGPNSTKLKAWIKPSGIDVCICVGTSTLPKRFNIDDTDKNKVSLSVTTIDYTKENTCGEIVKQCTSGACCDANGLFKKPVSVCKEDALITNACNGSAVETIYYDQFCSGTSSSCDGNLVAVSGQSRSCSTNQVCTDGNCITKQCTSGACCDVNGFFKTSGSICQSNILGTKSCNLNTVVQQLGQKVCSGLSASCDSNTIWVGSVDLNVCVSPYLCSNAACVKPACSSNAECGSDAWVGGTSCSDKNVIGLWRTYKCNSPGTLSASCSFTDSNKVKSVCASNQVCSSGTCVNVACFSDAECNDNNSLTQDVCTNPGTISARCTNSRIVCSLASQCGTDSFIGNPYCDGNSVFQTYRWFTCSNAGTINSSCSFTDTNLRRIDCGAGRKCSNGECVDACTPNLTCSSWSTCVSGSQSRVCSDGCGYSKTEYQACTMPTLVQFRTSSLNYESTSAVAFSSSCGGTLKAFGGTLGACTEYNCSTSTAQFLVPNSSGGKSKAWLRSAGNDFCICVGTSSLPRRFNASDSDRTKVSTSTTPTNSTKEVTCTPTPTKQCTLGACCDTLGYFKPQGAVCLTGSSSNKYCSGAAVMIQTFDQLCSGKSASCDGNKVNISTSVYEICDPNEACSNGACISSCNPQWVCDEWSACMPGSTTQTRNCTDMSNCGTDANKPITSQACPVTCTPSWTCSNWIGCVNNTTTRTCTDSKNCGTTLNKPITQSSCTPCIDTDAKNSKTLGTTKGAYTNSTPTVITSKTDYCTSSKTVREYYCKDTLNPSFMDIICSVGCSGGKCI